MILSLEGKNAVICGSSQGIGFAIAEELALMGANCTLIARNAASLERVLNFLDTTLRQIHSYVVADFSNTAEVQAAIEGIVAKGTVHILVNNTGGPPGGPVIEAQEEEFISAFHQHLINNHILAKSVVPGMKQEGYGRIINIISTSVKIPIKNLGVSNTIRGAVASWAKSMSNELGAFNITVNNVLPGFTETRRLESLIASIAARNHTTPEAVADEIRSEVPMKRFGTAAEVAAVAAFLASPAAAYVNGTSIPVDGGRTGTI